MGKKDKKSNGSNASFYSLFVKFSRRVPNPLNIQDEVRALYSDVQNVRKPRQKNARWILIDFNTSEHAEACKKILEEKKHIATLPVKVKKLNIKQHDPVEDKPDNERQDKLNDLARTTFKASKLEKYSNKLLITNIPKTITMEELRELFPGHEKIDLKQKPTTRAYVTYSSAKEAMNMRMALKPVIAKEKYRVIVLLLNSDKSKNVQTPKAKTGRYFENSVE